MRLLFLSTYFPRPLNPQIGTWALEQAVAAQQLGHDVITVSLTPQFPKLLGEFHRGIRAYSHSPHQCKLEGIQTYYPRWQCYPLHPMRRLMNAAPRFWLDRGWRSARELILEIVDTFSPDAIIANHTLINGFVASKIHAATRTPYVTIDHEFGDFHQSEINKSWKRIFGEAAENASAVFSISNRMKEVSTKIFPDIKFETVYNGAAFSPCTQEVLQRHSEDSKELRIFCCSNFCDRKQIPQLMRAFYDVWKENKNVVLRIAGDGPSLAQIKSTADELKCDAIKLLGRLSRAEVDSEMKSADVFALVGRDEPFGIVYLEALANGCPLLLSSDCGAAEIMTDGVHALFADPNNFRSIVDGLRQLTSSAQLRQKLANNGHKLFSKSCSWRQTIQRYLECFQIAPTRKPATEQFVNA